jgi:outer membrane protein
MKTTSRFISLPIAAAVLVLFLCVSNTAANELSFDLNSAIQFALAHNPSLKSIKSSIDSEKFNIDAAKSERMPRIDFTTGVTRYKYPTALTPMVIEPPFQSLESNLPKFEETVYDGAASFRISLFRGGRILRNIRIAEMRKSLAEDTYASASQDLAFNVTSVYYKILQLKKLHASQESSVAQLAAHKVKAEQFYQAGTAARLDVLRADTELARGKDSRLVTGNALASTLELFKSLLGIDDLKTEVVVTETPADSPDLPLEDDSPNAALAHRIDYRALEKKIWIAQERIRAASSKRMGELTGAGEYSKRAGNPMEFKENWYIGLRYSLPVFDGGFISSEVNRERVELSRLREDEKALRMAISREVKDALLAVEAAAERMSVTTTAISSAQEAARIERLKYETGAGTSTDVLDAQTALIRAETDSYQAAYDRMVGYAQLKKAMGEYQEKKKE